MKNNPWGARNRPSAPDDGVVLASVPSFVSTEPWLLQENNTHCTGRGAWPAFHMREDVLWLVVWAEQQDPVEVLWAFLVRCVCVHYIPRINAASLCVEGPRAWACDSSPAAPALSWWACSWTDSACPRGTARTRWTGTSPRRRRRTQPRWSPSGRDAPTPVRQAQRVKTHMQTWT